ncbi:MAG: helix-turn-helix domain-containing protein, partial [Rhodoferax sp.]
VTVMAPAQVIEPKDLPPEVGVTTGGLGEAPTPGPMSAATMVEHTGEHLPYVASAVLPQTSAIALAPTAHASAADWELGLEADAIALLATGRHDVWDELTRRFESRLILAALAATRGRRIEAAQKLGIGRNTITRKIQELGLE